MTAKEKAKELVKKYACLNRGEIENDWKNRDIIFDSLDIECALIAVDEILKAVESDWSFMEVRQEYWKEVKQEIKKI